MSRLLILFFALLPATVHAHTGHLAEVAGHGHWLGAAAIGAAIAIGLWAAAKGRKDAEASDMQDAEPEIEDAQEA